MLEIIGLISTALAVTGVILNNRRLISCFYLWLFSNAICAYLHYHTELYSLLLRDLIFLALAFEGLYRWSLKEKP